MGGAQEKAPEVENQERAAKSQGSDDEHGMFFCASVASFSSVPVRLCQRCCQNGRMELRVDERHQDYQSLTRPLVTRRGRSRLYRRGSSPTSESKGTNSLISRGRGPAEAGWKALSSPPCSISTPAGAKRLNSSRKIPNSAHPVFKRWQADNAIRLSLFESGCASGEPGLATVR